MLKHLHPEFQPYAQALLELVDYAITEGPEPDTLASVLNENPRWSAAYDWAMETIDANAVGALGGNVFALPLLHPNYCQKLIDEAQRLEGQHGYRPNPLEEAPYQMPEIVLQHTDAALYNELAEFIQYLGIWFVMIYQNRPTKIGTIQFAKYEPDGTAHGNWHRDQDSAYSAVVSLDQDRFTGGGTEVLINPLHSVAIPALPAGYVLLFNGQQIRHRGRAVTSGVRHLLVFWLQ